MAEITLKRARIPSDVSIGLYLKDNGVAVAWTSLEEVRVHAFSVEQNAFVGACAASPDADDPTQLNVTYPASTPQYPGVAKLVVFCRYRGRVKSYDVPVVYFVKSTEDVTGYQVIDDPEVDVAIQVEDATEVSVVLEVADVSTSLLDQAIQDAEDAADAANAAAQDADAAAAAALAAKEDADTAAAGANTAKQNANSAAGRANSSAANANNAAAKANAAAEHGPKIVTGTWWVWDATNEEYVDTGIAATGPQGPQGEQGEQGEQGIQGAKGDKGDQGNTGSSVEYPYELVNNRTTDDATKGLSAAEGKRLGDDISQLGQKVDNLDSVPIDVAELTQVNYAYVTSSNKWTSATGRTGSFIPVSAGQKVRITAGTEECRYCFLTAEPSSITAGGTPPFVTGTEVNSLNANESLVVTIPSGCTSLQINRFYNATDYSPASVSILGGRFQADEANIATLQTSVASLGADLDSLDARTDKIEDTLDAVLTETRELSMRNAIDDATNSNTTCTGIAFALCENKKVYKIAFQLGNRSYTGNPISTIKVTLRKDAVDGELLASKTISFSENDNSLHDVVADFSDAPIEYSGFIFCLIQTDGLLKHRDIAVSDYFEGKNRYYTDTGGFEEGVQGVWAKTTGTTSYVAYSVYVYDIIPALAVDTDDIKDDAVTTDKVADEAITTDKLADESVTEEKLAVVITNNEKGVRVVLPTNITVVAGSNLQLFYRGIISAFDPYAYNVEVTVLNRVTGVTIGYTFPRYYQLTATNDNVGVYDVEIKVRRNDNSIIASGTSVINVIAVPSSPASQKNILAFGASVLSYGFIVSELERRLTLTTGTEGDTTNPKGLGLSNIAFIGRKTGSLVPSVHQEATGGLGWNNYAQAGTNRYRFYITDGSGDNIAVNEQFALGGATFKVKEKDITGGSGSISCSYSGTPGEISASGVLPLSSGNVNYSSYIVENTNAFWNVSTSQIDFANYSNTYCGGATIDILLSHLGVNSMAGETWDLETIVGNIKTIARAFHSYNANGKFVISTIAVPDPTGGFGYNYHANGAISNYYIIVRRFFEFAEAIDELAQDTEFSSYVIHCPVMPECDGENMYPKYEFKLNNRVSTKEKIGANAYHPSTTDPFGYYMIADAIYQTLCAVIR